MIFVYPKNRGSALVISVILTGICLGTVLMAFSTISMTSIESLFTIFITIPLFGLMLASPGLAVAYTLLAGRKNKPKFLSCMLGSILIGGLIAFLCAPIWTELGKQFAFCFIAGGPLTGLFYYLILKQAQEIDNGNPNKL